MTAFERPLLFDEAIRRFDDANAQDPNRAKAGDHAEPAELFYSRRLYEWVLRLEPNASEALKLAARCQHLCRWEIPRSSYPSTRAGYLRWREELKRFHARRSGEILREVGYSDVVVRRVQELNEKRGLGTDAECQVLEDALCLMFLEYQLSELANKLSEEKVITALRKSWTKMSSRGRAAALQVPLGQREKTLVNRALSDIEA
jgi:hypothetical protein